MGHLAQDLGPGDLGPRSGRDDRTLVHRDHDLGEVEELDEFGGDEDHRVPPSRLADETVNLLAAANVDAPGGVVEQQELALETADAAADEDLLLVAATQPAHRLAQPVLTHADDLKQRLRRFPACAV